MEAKDVTAIVLAAGFSRRMGKDKLLLPFGSGTLLSHAVELLLALPFGQRLLVTTPARRQALRLPETITVIENHAPHAGQSTSVKLGTAAAQGKAYLFLTADQPFLNRQTVEYLLGFADETHIVYPTSGGNPASPVLFPACFREALLQLEGDQGGRSIRQAHPEAQYPIEIAYPHVLRDIDTQSDYDELLGDCGGS